VSGRKDVKGPLPRRKELNPGIFGFVSGVRVDTVVVVVLWLRLCYWIVEKEMLPVLMSIV
tara:strand:- start:10721 stop:10900 length:180 start_codon:yes stop_codon:yes gene_type:complete